MAASVFCSVDLLVYNLCDLLRFFGEFLKFVRQNRLHPVRKRALGVVMDFNEQPIGAHGNRSSRKSQDLVTDTGGMAWVDYDRQMAAPLHGRNDGYVQRVT